MSKKFSFSCADGFCGAEDCKTCHPENSIPSNSPYGGREGNKKKFKPSRQDRRNSRPDKFADY
jgi:hypothetical protein